MLCEIAYFIRVYDILISMLVCEEIKKVINKLFCLVVEIMKLNDKYVNSNEKLQRDLKIIQQAFINVYGQKYFDYIVNKFKCLKIIWYDDEVLNFEDINDVIATDLPKNIVDGYLQKYSKNCFFQSAYIDELDVLVLPLSYNLTHIVHEVNHKISSHVLSLNPLNIISGLCISVQHDDRVIQDSSDLNEVINHKMTMDVLEELKNLGVELDVTPSWQENLFPLIDMFYTNFKDNLKEVYATGNLISFVESVGKNNYNEFTQLMFLKCFNARRKMSKGQTPVISENDIKQVEEIVSSMNEFYCKQNNNLNIKK